MNKETLLTKKTTELKELAKTLGIKNIAKYKKAELVEKIISHTEKATESKSTDVVEISETVKYAPKTVNDTKIETETLISSETPET
ncbi:MAG: Rho termination factor N-terminal domain-containing protein [Oscillospiraceae bacterium]